MRGRVKGRVKRYNWIAWMVNENQFSIGAEIGAAIGITTEFLLKNCPTIQNLTVVDMWEPVRGSYTFDREDMEKVFRSKFEGEMRLTILKGQSWEMASHLADKILDFVFIDASHDDISVTKDIQAWTPKVRQGGVVCGHDINLPGVRRATNNIFGTRLKEAGIDNMWYVLV